MTLGSNLPGPALELVHVEIAKLSLKAGDILVASLPHTVDREECERIRAHLQRGMPEGVSVMCKTKAIELSVLEAGPA
ncbi:hypothetical protein LXA47_03935 [Massilia sp. P8910]|uniref:hypothetical protein n=1 Tax=Massilia antarctica TaxID=2765360 RepID=UPI001E32C978|nr:hypothetical protein [Massilia antarctica]MCE3602748.1 hypothetical protein [Massilia antarctica]